MTFHNHPPPGTPDEAGPTLVESNDRFCTVGCNLGDLVMVLPRTVWHDNHPRYELRFRHGTIQISHTTFANLIAKGIEANPALMDGSSA
jgi:hypothetical protein